MGQEPFAFARWPGGQDEHNQKRTEIIHRIKDLKRLDEVRYNVLIDALKRTPIFTGKVTIRKGEKSPPPLVNKDGFLYAPITPEDYNRIVSKLEEVDADDTNPNAEPWQVQLQKCRDALNKPEQPKQDTPND